MFGWYIYRDFVIGISLSINVVRRSWFPMKNDFTSFSGKEQQLIFNYQTLNLVPYLQN